MIKKEKLLFPAIVFLILIAMSLAGCNRNESDFTVKESSIVQSNVTYTVVINSSFNDDITITYQEKKIPDSVKNSLQEKFKDIIFNDNIKIEYYNSNVQYVYQSVAPNGLKVGVDYYLKNKESNKYASVKNASTQSGTIIQQWQAETEPHFRFRVEYLGNNLYVIRPMSNESLALDVYNASSQSGAAVQQYTWNNTNAQKWYITLNADGTYRLSAACATNNALTVVTPYNQNGSSINSITYSGSNAQKWCFEEARNYTSTVNNYFDNARSIGFTIKFRIVRFMLFENIVDGSQQHSCNCNHGFFVTSALFQSIVTADNFRVIVLALDCGKRTLNQ